MDSDTGSALAAIAVAVAGALVLVVGFTLVVFARSRMEETGRRRPVDIALLTSGTLACALTVVGGLIVFATGP